MASFNAGDCEDPGFSRLTLVLNANDAELIQCLKQLDKLIDVVECEQLTPATSVQRELTLIRVEPEADKKEALYNLVLEFLGKTPLAAGNSIIVEFTGEVGEVQRLIEALRPYNITEIVRTGAVAIKVEA